MGQLKVLGDAVLSPPWPTVLKSRLSPATCFRMSALSQAGQTGLGSASESHFSRLWGIRAVPTCLAPGPGTVRTGGL